MKSTYSRAQAKIDNGGRFTDEEWGMVKNLYDHRCVHCGEKESPTVILSADHIIPLRHGGSNDISNIQPLCKSCNSSKNCRFSTDYRDTFFDVLNRRRKINLFTEKGWVCFRANASLLTRFMPAGEYDEGRYQAALEMLSCWKLPSEFESIARGIIDGWFKAA